MKKILKTIIPLIILVLFLTGCTSYMEESKTMVFPSEKLKVHFIDVGQGDAIFIQSKDENMLIDGGNSGDADLIINYLKKNGVKTLKYIIGTHPHEDHIGGLGKIIETFDVKDIMIPEKEHPTKTFENFIDQIAVKGLLLTKPIVGSKYTLGNSSFTIISPNRDYGNDLNNWSLGIKLVNGNNSFVMYGDASETAEKDILKNGINLKADVLKLAHHGSETSTSNAILDAVNPAYVVITADADNNYGHPHQETLDKLAKRNITIFSTYKNGTIVAESNGNKITWTTNK
ncbi:MAG: ComEC/Rec2 family competence protein [Eubacteriaceae bacterium]